MMNVRLVLVIGVQMCVRLFCFFKQKTAYEMRISDWSSDVCSSDLATRAIRSPQTPAICRPTAVLPVNVTLSTRESRTRASAASLPAGSTLPPPSGNPAQPRHSATTGSASLRERVCQYAAISGVADTFQTNPTHDMHQHRNQPTD